MKYLLITILLLKCIVSFAQKDTVIDDMSFEIIKRFPNGKCKEVGQYVTNCSDSGKNKTGLFITFNKHGKQVRKRWYAHNRRICRRIFGLKQGWDGIYGPVRKYFLGFVIKCEMIDPCF